MKWIRTEDGQLLNLAHIELIAVIPADGHSHSVCAMPAAKAVDPQGPVPDYWVLAGFDDRPSADRFMFYLMSFLNRSEAVGDANSMMAS